MNWLDIVIILFLIYAVWEGWKHGVITQVLGLAAVALGIYLAYRGGGSIGAMLGLEGIAASAAGFAVILVAVIVAVVLAGRLTRGLFRIAGLGVFDRILGALFSVFKICVITGAILMAVAALDPEGRALAVEVRESSVMYRKVTGVAGYTFPFIESATKDMFDRGK